MSIKHFILILQCMPLRIPIVCAVRCWDSHHVMYSSSYLTEPTITCPYRPVSLRLSHSHSGLQWNEHKNLFWYYDFFGWAIFFFFLNLSSIDLSAESPLCTVIDTDFNKLNWYFLHKNPSSICECLPPPKDTIYVCFFMLSGKARSWYRIVHY